MTFAPFFLSAQPTWQSFGSLREGRNNFGAMAISRTQVLVMGGYQGSCWMCNTPTASCEILDVERRTVNLGAAMNVAHAEAAWVQMPDSSIVAVSGASQNTTLTNTCERFDPKTNQWTVVGALRLARRQHTAIALNNDEILVVGGLNQGLTTLNSAEILNIRTGQSKSIADFPTPANLPLSGKLADGSIVMMAGRAGGTNSFRSPNVYRYVQNDNRWATLGALTNGGVAAAHSFTLSDASVIISGGQLSESPYIFSRTLHRVSNDGVKLISSQLTPRAWHQVVQWNQDSLLVIGGDDERIVGRNSTEWVNMRTGEVSVGPSLQQSRFGHIVVQMPVLDSSNKNVSSRFVAISGMQTVNTPVATIEILESSTAPPVLDGCPPVTITQTQSCTALVATLAASVGDGIASVALDSTQGNLQPSAVQVQIQAQVQPQGQSSTAVLPARSAQVTVTLREGASGGRVLLRGRTTSGCAFFVGAELPGGASAPVVIEAATGGVFSTSFPQATGIAATLQVAVPRAVSCATLTLRNTSSRAFTIPAVRFDRAGEFFAPASRLPLVLPAGGTCAMELCFSAESTGLFRNAVTFRTATCEEFRLPLIGIVGGRVVAERVVAGQIVTEQAAAGQADGLTSQTASEAVSPMASSDGANVSVNAVANVNANAVATAMLQPRPPVPHPADEQVELSALVRHSSLSTGFLPTGSLPIIERATLRTLAGQILLRLGSEAIRIERTESAEAGTYLLRCMVNVRALPAGVYQFSATVGGVEWVQTVVVRH
jgi:hypothetical protein